MSEFIIKAGSAWDRILRDHELANARRKLSLHEIRLIIRHTLEASRAAPVPTKDGPAPKAG